MNVLSLFSGIGGLDLGLQRAGMTIAGQVEIDPWCRKVLAKHWPEVPRHDDVRTAADWWGGRPAPDLVAGGFPCQPFSYAGLQRGVADPRWMWPAFADVIAALRPRIVVVENVAALVRDGRAFGWLLADLHGLGFDAEWSIVSACSLGASHTRDRLFLVAHAHGAGSQGLHDACGRVNLQPATSALRQDWEAEPGVDRVAYGLPHGVDRLRGLGNAVVPQVAEHIGRLIMDAAA
jgi:DNA (cytosine-5)-methyltransferase 1